MQDLAKSTPVTQNLFKKPQIKFSSALPCCGELCAPLPPSSGTLCALPVPQPQVQGLSGALISPHLASPKERLSHLFPSPSQSPPREKAELLHLQKGITDYLQPCPNLCFLQGSLDIATNSCKAHLSQNGLEKWDLAAAGPTGDTRRFPEADTAPKTSHPLPPGMSQTLKGWGCPAATLRGLFGNRFLSPFHQHSAQRRFRGHREGTGRAPGRVPGCRSISSRLPRAFPAPVAAGEPQGSGGQGRGLLWQQHAPVSPY